MASFRGGFEVSVAGNSNTVGKTGTGAGYGDCSGIVLGRGNKVGVVDEESTTGSKLRYKTTDAFDNKWTDSSNTEISSDDAKIPVQKGTNAIAIGTGNAFVHRGDTGVAVGDTNSICGAGSVVVGKNSITSGSNSVSIGYGNCAAGNKSVAIGGACTSSSAHCSVAIGKDANACIACAAAVGAGSKATGYYSFAGGAGNALGNCTVSIGKGAHSNGEYSSSLGMCSCAGNNYGLAVGFGAYAQGCRSTTLGYKARTTCGDSVSVGVCTCAAGVQSVAIGSGTRANQQGVAIGSSACACGNYGVALGLSAQACGQYSVAVGYGSKAACCAVAAGYLNCAIGAGSVLIGGTSDGWAHRTLNGENSVKVGGCMTLVYCAYASGIGGYHTCNYGNNSHMIGGMYTCVSSSANSNVMLSGYKNYAHCRANYSVALGGISTYLAGCTALVAGHGCESKAACCNAYKPYACNETFAMGTCQNTIVLCMRGGNGYFDGGADMGSADYAEFFEHSEKGCFCRGYFASWKDGTNKVCAGNNDIMGIVSSDPAINGDATIHWTGKWKRDEFGRKVEEICEHGNAIMFDLPYAEAKDMADDKGTIPFDKLFAYVRQHQDNNKETMMRKIGSDAEDPEYESYLRLEKHDEHPKEYSLDEVTVVETDVNMDGEITDDEQFSMLNIHLVGIYKEKSHVISKDYDSDQEFITRAERPEWSPIGLLGKLWVYKADPKATYTVGAWVTSDAEGKAKITKKNDTKGAWRVIEVKENIVRVLFK